MVVPENSINNIMGGLESTGGVRLHTHRRKLKQRFDILRKLGQGTYGKVQLGVNKETGQEVAIKTIKKCKIETEADLIRIRREIQIMSSLRHPYIIHIYEVFENKDKILLVMEYAAGGELYDYLSERKVLEEQEARRIFRQISTAVFYCHKHQICHRDLKLENILLDEERNAKIADFGLSNVFDPSRLLSTFCGSPLYASPEIVKGIPYHGPEVDCWSLGVLLYTLVYGTMPFDGSNFKRLVRQISEGEYYEPKTPSNATKLIRGLLTVDGLKRFDIARVCRDSWMTKEDEIDCSKLALQLSVETPVRLDLLLALAPPPTPPQTAQPPPQPPEAVQPTPQVVANDKSPPQTLSRTPLHERQVRSQSLGSIPNTEPGFILQLRPRPRTEDIPEVPEVPAPATPPPPPSEPPPPPPTAAQQPPEEKKEKKKKLRERSSSRSRRKEGGGESSDSGKEAKRRVAKKKKKEEGEEGQPPREEVEKVMEEAKRIEEVLGKMGEVEPSAGVGAQGATAIESPGTVLAPVPDQVIDQSVSVSPGLTSPADGPPGLASPTGVPQGGAPVPGLPSPAVTPLSPAPSPDLATPSTNLPCVAPEAVSPPGIVPSPGTSRPTSSTSPKEDPPATPQKEVPPPSPMDSQNEAAAQPSKGSPIPEAATTPAQTPKKAVTEGPRRKSRVFETAEMFSGGSPPEPPKLPTAPPKKVFLPGVKVSQLLQLVSSFFHFLLLFLLSFRSLNPPLRPLNKS